jgi:hypothetical protein
MGNFASNIQPNVSLPFLTSGNTPGGLSQPPLPLRQGPSMGVTGPSFRMPGSDFPRDPSMGIGGPSFGLPDDFMSKLPRRVIDQNREELQDFGKLQAETDNNGEFSVWKTLLPLLTGIGGVLSGKEGLARAGTLLAQGAGAYAQGQARGMEMRQDRLVQERELRLKEQTAEAARMRAEAETGRGRTASANSIRTRIGSAIQQENWETVAVLAQSADAEKYLSQAEITSYAQQGVLGQVIDDGIEMTLAGESKETVEAYISQAVDPDANPEFFKRIMDGFEIEMDSSEAQVIRDLTGSKNTAELDAVLVRYVPKGKEGFEQLYDDEKTSFLDTKKILNVANKKRQELVAEEKRLNVQDQVQLNALEAAEAQASRRHADKIVQSLSLYNRGAIPDRQIAEEIYSYNLPEGFVPPTKDVPGGVDGTLTYEEYKTAKDASVEVIINSLKNAPANKRADALADAFQNLLLQEYAKGNISEEQVQKMIDEVPYIRERSISSMTADPEQAALDHARRVTSEGGQLAAGSEIIKSAMDGRTAIPNPGVQAGKLAERMDLPVMVKTRVVEILTERFEDYNKNLTAPAPEPKNPDLVEGAITGGEGQGRLGGGGYTSDSFGVETPKAQPEAPEIPDGTSGEDIIDAIRGGRVDENQVGDWARRNGLAEGGSSQIFVPGTGSVDGVEGISTEIREGIEGPLLEVAKVLQAIRTGEVTFRRLSPPPTSPGMPFIPNGNQQLQTEQG